jgi:hypothetical protein
MNPNPERVQLPKRKKKFCTIKKKATFTPSTPSLKSHFKVRNVLKINIFLKFQLFFFIKKHHPL